MLIAKYYYFLCVCFAVSGFGCNNHTCNTFVSYLKNAVISVSYILMYQLTGTTHQYMLLYVIPYRWHCLQQVDLHLRVTGADLPILWLGWEKG